MSMCTPPPAATAAATPRDGRTRASTAAPRTHMPIAFRRRVTCGHGMRTFGWQVVQHAEHGVLGQPHRRDEPSRRRRRRRRGVVLDPRGRWRRLPVGGGQGRRSRGRGRRALQQLWGRGISHVDQRRISGPPYHQSNAGNRRDQTTVFAPNFENQNPLGHSVCNCYIADLC